MHQCASVNQEFQRKRSDEKSTGWNRFESREVYGVQSYRPKVDFPDDPPQGKWDRRPKYTRHEEMFGSPGNRG